MRMPARIGVGALALAAVAPSACKQKETHLDKLIASASAAIAPPPEPTKPFAFPTATGLPPSEIIPVVNRAVRESPPGQENRIDTWLRGVSIPVVLLGPTDKFASEVGAASCRYGAKKLDCSIPAEFPTTAKFFVASSLSCLDASGKVLEKADWDEPAKSRRGERVDLPVPDGFLEDCLTRGGVKLGVEILTSPCAIPFPHQVRCAGEYRNCREACKETITCEDRCESNRVDCLDVCKK